VDKPLLTYASSADASPEIELSTLANVYRFVLDCHAKKEAATSPVSRPDDTTMKNAEEVGYVDQWSD
jgi:hypothetical protein